MRSVEQQRPYNDLQKYQFSTKREKRCTGEWDRTGSNEIDEQRVSGSYLTYSVTFHPQQVLLLKYFNLFRAPSFDTFQASSCLELLFANWQIELGSFHLKIAKQLR